VQNVLIGRRYRLTEEIGSGGMADVYKGVDETLGNRPVAVKLMHAHLANDPSFTARFQQEAMAAANLQSPYIVNIYDWGQETQADGQSLYYIVMEYIPGEDLKSKIRREGALPSQKVAEYAAMVCSALTVAHGYDIIHRDIKPHNIMVLPDDNIKVMDFGIARAGNTQMTQTGSVLGSAHYVSPEQAQGRPLTAASDLYSLGVVMYEAATGKMPFDGDSPVATALKQVQEQPVRPTSINPNIDPELEQVIGYAMAKDPRARYATADAMRRDLVRVVRGEPIVGAHGNADDDATAVMGAAGGAVLGGRRDPQEMDGTTVMPAVDGVSPATPMTPANERSVGPEKKKKNVWIWVVLIIALLAAAGLIAWQLGVFDQDEDDPIATAYMPNVTGYTLEAAQERLREEGIAIIVPPEIEALPDEVLEPVLPEANPDLITIEEEFSPDVPEGHIISHDPEAGEHIEDPVHAEVTLVVSKGIEMFRVPELRGMTLQEAERAVADADFVIESSTEHNTEVPAGQIISQDPGEGRELPGGSVIQVVVSEGVENINVPNVRTMTRQQASTTLTNAGFQVNVSEVFNSDVSAGVVIDQNPREGAALQRGSTVEITVSRGPENVAVPNVLNNTETAATTALTNAGFTARTIYAVGDFGVVIEQEPRAGQRVSPGSTVTITVGSGTDQGEDSGD